MNGWMDLWARSVQINLGAPEVIARRMAIFNNPALWNLGTPLEAQGMIVEKMQAMSESWTALSRMATPMTGWNLLTPTAWTAKSTDRRTRSALRSGNQALAAYSKRVNANVKRLRKV